MAASTRLSLASQKWPRGLVHGRNLPPPVRKSRVRTCTMPASPLFCGQLTIGCSSGRLAASGPGYVWSRSVLEAASGRRLRAAPAIGALPLLQGLTPFCYCVPADAGTNRLSGAAPVHGLRTLFQSEHEKRYTFWAWAAILKITGDCFCDLINWFRWVGELRREGDGEMMGKLGISRPRRSQGNALSIDYKI